MPERGKVGVDPPVVTRHRFDMLRGRVAEKAPEAAWAKRDPAIGRFRFLG